MRIVPASLPVWLFVGAVLSGDDGGGQGRPNEQSLVEDAIGAWNKDIITINTFMDAVNIGIDPNPGQPAVDASRDEITQLQILAKVSNLDQKGLEAAGRLQKTIPEETSELKVLAGNRENEEVEDFLNKLRCQSILPDTQTLWQSASFAVGSKRTPSVPFPKVCSQPVSQRPRTRTSQMTRTQTTESTRMTTETTQRTTRTEESVTTTRTETTSETQRPTSSTRTSTETERRTTSTEQSMTTTRTETTRETERPTTSTETTQRTTRTEESMTTTQTTRQTERPTSTQESMTTMRTETTRETERPTSSEERTTRTEETRETERPTRPAERNKNEYINSFRILRRKAVVY
ncbi:hypothetical protein PRK78_007104 [Emydomyces testavorans]|uniref:Uncharacterized protein n=1 Tax=Emydomyces testavorans TaxID=2070801 RepID=A0AAF0DNR9_9EURO|nr:hypothetical protein PRK78_007104 [Emydomyces testavorans]